MPDFGKLFGKAKEQAGKNPDQVKKGIDKLQEFADKHLDDKYDGQIQKAGDMAERALGVDGQDGAANDAAQQGSAAQPGNAEGQDGSR